MLKLPAEEKSYWREAYVNSVYPELKEDLEVDVVIVGAGITGLTSAYLLKKSGLTVAVLDKSTVGGGTTGRTTGKVTSQHNLIYHDLQNRLGKKTAQVYAEANQSAVELIEKIIKKEKIICGWSREDNYVYTTSSGKVETFKNEVRTANSLGLPATFEATSPLPFDIKGAVRFSGQAKIHSQQYLLGLARAVNGNGSYVFENSNVTGIRDGSPGRIKTAKARVFAKNIIIATNVPAFPLMARGGFCILEYPTESYIVAGPLSKDQSGMFISPDKNNYSILPVDTDNGRLLLVGGKSHISGLRGSTKNRCQQLADYGEKHFGLSSISHRWSDRDYIAYDGIPLAGKLYPWSKNLYTASAFRKWGLSNGTASAMILHDLITGKENKWASTFTPNRLKPIKSIPRVFTKYVSGNF